MKRPIKTLILSTLALIPGLALAAGPSTGGGGYAVACNATPFEPASFELLDIYEGYTTFGFTMAKAQGTTADEYFLSAKRTYTIQGRPEYADQVRKDIYENVRKIGRTMRFVEKAEDLPKADDLGSLPWIPSGCKLQQVAFYEDGSETIIVLRSGWDRLDSLNQAALLQHETWYHYNRRLGDTNSSETRKSVAHMFALEGLTPILEGIGEGEKQYSAGDEHNQRLLSSFYLLPQTKQGFMRLQFTQLAGRPVLNKAYADFKPRQWNLKFGRSPVDPALIGCIVQDKDVNAEEEGWVMTGNGIPTHTVRYTYRTGLPITFTVFRGEQEISKGEVHICN